MLPPPRIFCIFALTLGLTACGMLPPGAAAPGTLPLRVLYRGAVCDPAPAQPAGRWIADLQTYHALYRAVAQSRRPGSESAPPPVDFTREGVLWITMGQKPTGGYALEPVGSEFVVKGETAILQLDWSVPPPGAILTQVITAPCLLLALPRGAYTRIRVLDRNGQERLLIPAADTAADAGKPASAPCPPE